MAYTYLANATSAAINVSSYDQYYEEDDIDPRVFSAMCGIVVVLTAVGVVGNSFIIYIVLRNRSMRNRPNALVASLAVGDLLVLLVCVPPRAYQMISFQWPFGTVMCKLSHGSAIVSQAVSILSMVALSHDRYRAIVTPINYQSRGTSRTFVVIAVIWFLAIVMSFPAVIFSHASSNQYFAWCKYIDHSSIQGQIHAVLRSILLFFMPLSIISAYYCMVSRKLIGSTRSLPGEVHDKRSQISSRKRLAYLVLAIVILFTICWLPSVIFDLLFQIDAYIITNSNSLTYLRILSEILTYANSCINPILITVVSSTYRKYFASYLCCCCYQKARFKRPRNSTVSSKASSTRTRITEFA